MCYVHGYEPFFVRTAIARIVSLLYVMEDGSSVEIAVVGNRHHSVEQQLCRWLLLSLDRLPSNELTMTQELIANMLGVRREGGDRGCRQPAGGGADPLQPRQDQGTAGPTTAA